MLGLKALQQGRERQYVQEGMEESQVDERVGVKTVHCPKSQNLAVLASKATCARRDILVPNPTSSGITEPHCTTLQIV